MTGLLEILVYTWLILGVLSGLKTVYKVLWMRPPYFILWLLCGCIIGAITGIFMLMFYIIFVKK